MSWLDNGDFNELNNAYFSRVNSNFVLNPENENFGDFEDLFRLHDKKVDYEELKSKLNNPNFYLNDKEYNILACLEGMIFLIIIEKSKHTFASVNNTNNILSSDNIYFNRTYLDRKQLSEIIKNYSPKTHCNTDDITMKMKLKRNRTKFLLSKTRRKESDSTKSDKIINLSNCYIKETASPTVSDINSQSSNNLKKSKNVNNYKKELKKQKNREAAQKSRLNRKLEYEILREKENALEELNNKLISENTLLRCELNKIKKQSDKLCDCCRKLFVEFKLNTCNGSTNHDFCKHKHDKRRFKVVQNPISRTTLTNTTTSSSLVSSTGKYTFFTGILVIVCLLGNFYFDSSFNNQNMTTQGRILLQNLTNNNDALSTLPNIPDVYDFAKMPSLIIDDQKNNKSFYLRFFDFFRLKVLKDISSNKSETKKPFLGKNSTNKDVSPAPVVTNDNSDNTKLSSKNSELCLNNDTFISFSNKHKDTPHYTDFTKVSGYIDLIFKDINSCNHIQNDTEHSTKDCCENDIKEENKENMKFKMVIPSVNDNQNKKANDFFDDLLHNFNESKIIEKNSKYFYYEVECKVLDINKITK